jgi:integrase
VNHRELRSTFVTLALQDNIAPVIVKEIVGHASLKTTDIYLRRAALHIHEQTEKLRISLGDKGVAPILKLC